VDNLDKTFKLVRRINNIRLALAGLLVIFLLILAIKGCYNNRAAIASYKKNQHELDSLTDDYLKTAQWWNEQKNRYTTALQLANGQIEIYQNREQSYRDSLDKASNQISILLAKHTPIKPNTDTSITVVPSEYVSDCEICFTQLQNGRDLVIRANNQRDSLDQSYKSKINIQANRINELGQQNKNLQATLTDAFSIAKKEEQKFAPRRILYFSPSILIWNGPLPRGIGVGFLYQDKQKRIVGAHVYGSEIGALYEANVALPLSFKRR
jgi:hypothetical protein